MIYCIIIIICFLVIYEFIISHNRRIRRLKSYRIAYNLARKKTKPLIVIGDPEAGWNKGMDYGCGDLCIDMIGCNNCYQQMKGKVHQILKNFSSNSAVIFISCVLEYVDPKDFGETLKQIKRVA